MSSLSSSGFRALPLSIAQLNLSAVLKCGQSFRWTAFPLNLDETQATAPHEYRFCLKDRVLCLRQSPDVLHYRSIYPHKHELESVASSSSSQEQTQKDAETLAFIHDYFQLDTNLVGLYDEWSNNDPVFMRLRDRFVGIRMLRQDPWECLISFICSSNNNISRISKMVHNLCVHFSPELLSQDDPSPSSTSESQPSKPTAYHPFPPPSALAAPSVSAKLRSLGFGYRADFIQKTAAMLLDAHGSDEGVYAFLAGLRKADTEYARVELMKLMGVGRKVADCILLMSLDKREVVPVDTHVHQIAVKHYGLRCSGKGKTAMSPKLYDEVNTKLAQVWGSYAGWAHSILFTADLKAFAEYSSPMSSPTKTKTTNDTFKQPQAVPDSPTKKRKHSKTKAEPESLSLHLEETKDLSSIIVEETSLADRVKKRTRVSVRRTREVRVDW